MLSKIIRIVLIAAMLAGLILVWSKSGEWKNTAREEATRPQTKYVEASKALIAALDITDLKGKPAKLPGTGRYRLINYWATWCGPCLMEMPLLNEFARSKAVGDVLVIGIALDEADAVKDYLKKTPSKYQQFLEKAGKNDSSNQLGNESGIIPFSVLIGPDGRLLKLKRGVFADADELKAFIKAPKASD
ncbi:MAG: TlpA disulfide reductase family protein [Arenimonas sp.]